MGQGLSIGKLWRPAWPVVLAALLAAACGGGDGITVAEETIPGGPGEYDTVKYIIWKEGIPSPIGVAYAGQQRLPAGDTRYVVGIDCPLDRLPLMPLPQHQRSKNDIKGLIIDECWGGTAPGGQESEPTPGEAQSERR